MSRQSRIRINQSTRQAEELAEKKRHLKAYFDNYVGYYNKKEAQKDSPAGPWRSDSEFGQLLAPRSATAILLGDDDDLSIYIENTINELIEGGGK